MLKQLTARFDPATRTAEFAVRCAAPPSGAAPECAAAVLDTGDGTRLDLGTLCTPGALAWHDAPDIPLGSHTYAGDGPFTAVLEWGSERFAVPVEPPPAAAPAADAGPALPALPLFEVRRDPANPFGAVVKVNAGTLPAGARVRIASGGGRVFWVDGDSGEHTFSLSFAKPGTYTVAADLVDARGFRLGALAETVVEAGAMGGPEQVPAEPAPPAPEAEATFEADTEVPPVAAAAAPWLPFAYARPLWAWTRTYKAPNGALSRSLAPGTYLAIRQERAVAGQLWYQTGEYDWVPATSVAAVTPSNLRGVALAGGEPEPEPEPGTRRGIVTATVLNVRARPGVSADNPPVGALRQGDEVTVHEEAQANGLWYRIGVNRWVSAAYVRLLPAASGALPAAQGAGGAEPAAPAMALPALQLSLPIGWVVSSSLYVRSGPGSGAPIVGELVHNQAVNVLETAGAGGATWYRVGPGQWASGAWIGVARPKRRPAGIGAGERWVGVSLKEQTAVAYEGDKPVYAALIASGLPGSPTVQGVFRTWWRVPSRKMSGPGYYLEEVTWTLYFHGGYALHTAYWHDAFGRPRSHGCVNLSPYDAWWLFQWSAPGGANAPAVYTYWA